MKEERNHEQVNAAQSPAIAPLPSTREKFGTLNRVPLNDIGCVDLAPSGHQAATGRSCSAAQAYRQTYR
jgi:hypothetical protein